VNITRPILATLALASFSQTAMSGEILLEENFAKPGSFGKKLLADRNVSLLPGGGPDGSPAIRVAYVGYEQGSGRIVASYPLSGRVKEATLSYDVRFSEDFQWVRGGKLHGLGPENPVTGGDPRMPEKWSARVMFKPDGRSMSYLYEQSPDTKYGVGDTSKAPVFTKGRWQHVDIQVSVNTPGKADGSFSVHIDGKRTNHQPAVEFRASDSGKTLISKMLFSTFHGGHTPSYAPKDPGGKYATVHADFDNFSVREGLAHADVP